MTRSEIMPTPEQINEQVELERDLTLFKRIQDFIFDRKHWALLS